jgi:hypothetical protein
MKNLFDSVSFRKPKQSLFDLSHEKKLSLNMGDLVPTLLQEVVPGDRFTVQQNSLVRMHPLLAPLMHRLDVYTHYFYVPWRLLWDDADSFFQETYQGLTILPNLKIYNSAGATDPSAINGFNKEDTKPGTLCDYLGIPDLSQKDMSTTPEINRLPFRAYQLIYNTYYRDNDLVHEVPISKELATDKAVDLITLRKRSWQKDYFTSARPWAIRDNFEVHLPITLGKNQTVKAQSTDNELPTGELNVKDGTLNQGGTELGDAYIDADINSPTIEELRYAEKLQEWLEKSARVGNRYIEHILAFFGVNPDPLRVHMPKYLGGGKQPIQISEVQSTANTDFSSNQGQTTSFLGELGGQGTSFGSNGFKYSVYEHGYIIGITSILPKRSYMQGINKLWTRKSQFDFLTPMFAEIGEEPIRNDELYMSGSPSDDKTFGYQERYASYKFNPNTVHGDFKDTLEYWHLASKFDNLPTLTQEFIEMSQERDGMNRIFPVQDSSHKFYMQIYYNIKAVRSLPYHSDPKL